MINIINNDITEWNGDPNTVIDLTDNRNYIDQKEILNNIRILYDHLTPANKTLVRLTITRNKNET